MAHPSSAEAPLEKRGRRYRRSIKFSVQKPANQLSRFFNHASFLNCLQYKMTLLAASFDRVHTIIHPLHTYNSHLRGSTCRPRILWGLRICSFIDLTNRKLKIQQQLQQKQRIQQLLPYLLQKYQLSQDVPFYQSHFSFLPLCRHGGRFFRGSRISQDSSKPQLCWCQGWQELGWNKL